jgi:hypothetical protein
MCTGLEVFEIDRRSGVDMDPLKSDGVAILHAGDLGVGCEGAYGARGEPSRSRRGADGRGQGSKSEESLGRKHFYKLNE